MAKQKYRAGLAKRFGITSLITAASAGLIWMAVGAMKSAHLSYLERGVKNEVETIYQEREDLVSKQKDLENLMEEIYGLEPLPVFSQRAENIYSAGVGEIEKRNLNEAIKKEQELLGIKKDVSQFNRFIFKTENLYKNVMAVAKEEQALEKGNFLYKEAKKFEASADIPKLSQAVSQLQELDITLNQAYTVRESKQEK